jgi:hypothetical protein
MARTHHIRQLYSILVIQAAMRGHSGMIYWPNDVEKNRILLPCLNDALSYQSTHCLSTLNTIVNYIFILFS